uniref:ATP synthase epsilon chain n=1 Tax=Ilyobacter tartaricus TaxID=167644 RepID=Q8KRU7_ILYTA|nr:subunit epsilon [Ilyobacter tartaricus]
MATFKLEVITPLKKIIEKEVEMIVLRTTEGDMGVLANHAPFVAELSIGEMKIKSSDEEVSYFVSGGFMDVSREKTTILADEAMDAREIDIEIAKKDAEVARAKLKKLKEDREIASTQKALQDALTKVRIAEQYR